MPVTIIVREFTESQINKIEAAVAKTGAKSRQTWCKHTLLKAVGVNEPLKKKSTVKR
jgi:hypothetical protein